MLDRLIIAACALLLAASAAAQSSQVVTIVHAGQLLADPASGRLELERSILIGAHGRIVGVEAGYVTRADARIVDLRSRFVLPGLIDSHVHLTNDEVGPQEFVDGVTLTDTDTALRAAGHARTTLLAGFTTVADLGASNDATFALRRAVDPHGDNWRELVLLVEAGYTPFEAIRLATSAAAEHLGIADSAGRIAPGFSADMLAVAANPTTDITQLRAISFVMARGVVHKHGE